MLHFGPTFLSMSRFLGFIQQMSTLGRKHFLQGRFDLRSKKRLRNNIADLLLDGSISGQRAQSLFQDAHSAAATGVGDLATPTSCPGNSLRNLPSRPVKGSKWNPPMEVQVPLENLKTHAAYEQPLYMMMPHTDCFEQEILRSC